MEFSWTSIKNPASQRSSSVGESSLGEQPTRYGNTTIDINVLDEVLRFSLRKMITCEMFLATIVIHHSQEVTAKQTLDHYTVYIRGCLKNHKIHKNFSPRKF